MSKRVAMIVVVAMIVASEAASAPEEHPLWFPGRRPGTIRPRNPGYPGATRPSTPSFPVTRPPPPTTGGESGSPSPRPEVPPSFGSGPTPPSSSPTDCVTPLAGLMTCGTFLTGSAPETPAPGSECCSGLSAFLNSSSATGDQTLRCLCPVILGDVNRMLPRPVDPVRMLYLPIACGVVLPPQALYICFTGQPTTPAAGGVPEIMKNPSSAHLSP